VILSELRTAVQAMTGDLDGVLFTVADIDRYLNMAQTEICRRARILQKNISGAQTLSSFDTYGGLLLPTDFLIEKEVYYGNPLVRLGKLPYDSFWIDQPTTTPSTATPTSYVVTDYLTGSQNNQRHMLFYPFMTPGLTNQFVRVGYIAKPAVLTSPTDIPNLPDQWHELIILMATRRCKIQEDDWQAATSLAGEAEKYYTLLLSEFQDDSDLVNYQIRDEQTTFYPIWDL